MPYLGYEPSKVAVTVGQGVIDATHIQDASITTADLGNDSVTPIKVDDDGTGFQMGSLGLGTAVSGSEKLTVGGTASFTGSVQISHGTTPDFTLNDTGGTTNKRVFRISGGGDAIYFEGRNNDNTGVGAVGGDGSIMSMSLSDASTTFTGDINLAATKTLFLDGASGHTFISEWSANKMQLQAGGQGSVILDGTNSGEIRMGVGTSSPASKIHAKVTTNTSETIRIQNDDSLTTMGVSSDGYSFHTYQHSWYWASWDGSTWSTKGRMDSHGNLGVGTTDFNNMSSSSYAGLKVGGATLQDSGGGNGSATFLCNNSYVGGSNNLYLDGGGASSAILMTSGDIDFLTFDGGGGSADAQWSYTPRMKIAQNGNVAIGKTSDASEKLEVYDGDILVSSGRGVRANGGNEMIRFHSSDGVKINSGGSQRYLLTTEGEFLHTTARGGLIGSFRNDHSSIPYGIKIDFDNATPNNTNQYFITCQDSTNDKFVVHSNGDVDSRTNSYSGISDERLKENIVDATSKLNDLNKVRIVNYNFKDDADNKHLGVIAQELQKIFPKMVNEVGEDKHLSVKYSIFVPMLIKAVQELSSKVEKLENA